MTRRRLGALFTIIALLAAGCAGGPAADEGGEGDPIKLGAVISLTGRFSDSATYMREGYQYWADEVNAAGGIDGQPVELVFYDDESSPETAAVLAQRLIEQDEVFMVLGPYGSGASDTMAVIMERQQVPMIAVVASDSAIWDRRELNWTFQGFPSSEFDHEAFLAIARRQDVERLAIVYEEAGFSIEAAEWAEPEAQAMGMEVRSYSYPPDTQDFGSIVAQISEFGPDAVSMGGYYAPALLLTGQMVERGLNPNGYGFIQASQGSTLEALGDNAAGILGRSSWEPQLDLPGNDEFVSGYEEEFDRPASYHAATAYAGGQVVAAAIETAGLDRQGVRDFLASETVDTVQGTYEVNEAGQQVGYRYVGIQWQGDEKQIVWPEQVADAEVVWPKPEW
ncbi:MAG: amino acid ABC transporter substrate-binding protein [Egibacteraceae bacterium]